MVIAQAQLTKLMIYSIGHSNHDIETFLELLRQHDVDTLIDVRTVPYSRRHPQFRKRDLEASCAGAGIAYRWRGEALGGIKRDSACRTFAEAAARPAFGNALEELIALARRHKPAIMCAEREPMDCHRTVLICRYLVAHPEATELEIQHILGDGPLEPHADFERRLVAAMGTGAPDLFAGDPVQAAYDARAARMLGR